MHDLTHTEEERKKMTAITLRNIPVALQEAIRQRAEKDGASLNRTVLRILEEATFGSRRQQRHHDLDHLAGTWSAEEAEVFESSLADQRRIDPEAWI
jgi:plasmid stability protein